MSDGQPRGNQTSDSTFGKVVRIDNDKRLEWLNRITETLENVYERLDVDMKKVWDEVIVKNVCPTYVEYEVGMERSTLFRKRKRIAYFCAIELGMLSQKS